MSGEHHRMSGVMDRIHIRLMNDCEQLAEELGRLCLKNQVKIATAESLTAGLIASTIVNVPGSSEWFERGFIVYNNTAKMQMLGVKERTLNEFTEVSGLCVLEMAQGALEHSDASLSVGVSGIAGPTGGTADNPVGTVWMAVATDHGSAETHKFVFAGDRLTVRLETVKAALEAMIHKIQIVR